MFGPQPRPFRHQTVLDAVVNALDRVGNVVPNSVVRFYLGRTADQLVTDPILNVVHQAVHDGLLSSMDPAVDLVYKVTSAIRDLPLMLPDPLFEDPVFSGYRRDQNIEPPPLGPVEREEGNYIHSHVAPRSSFPTRRNWNFYRRAFGLSNRTGFQSPENRYPREYFSVNPLRFARQGRRLPQRIYRRYNRATNTWNVTYKKPFLN